MNENMPNPVMGSKKRKISKGKLVAIIIIVLIVWFGAVQYMSAERYQAVVNVVEGDNKVGVNPTSERLDFGDLSRDTGSAKTVTLKNTGTRDKKIVVWKKGSIAELMAVSQNNFVLKAGEEVKIEFTVRIPVSAPYQKYDGKVVIFKWPKLW